MTAQVVKMSPGSLPFREVRQRPLDEEVPFVVVCRWVTLSPERKRTSFTRFGVSSSLLIIVAGGWEGEREASAGRWDGETRLTMVWLEACLARRVCWCVSSGKHGRLRSVAAVETAAQRGCKSGWAL